MEATPIPPFIGAFETEDMYQCYYQSLNMIGYESFRFWQGVSYNNSNSDGFTRNNGPFKGTPSPLYKSTIAPDVTRSSNILFNINDRVVSSTVENVKYCTPLITFYTNDTPTIDSVINIQFGQASLVTIKGNHFGKDHSYVLILIYGQQCKSPRFIGESNKQITCLLDVGLKPQSDNIMIRVAEMFTSIPLKQCYKDCNNRGLCDFLIGSCQCEIGYDPHVDCSSLANRYQLLTTTVFKITTSTLSTSQPIRGVIVNFTTGVQIIREIDQDNSIIRSISMDSVSWTQVNQTQDNLTSFNESIFHGTINNQSTKIQIKIGQFYNTTISTFAGEDMQMPSNSLKYTIKIIDWVWSSPYNTLQVIFHSRSDSVEYDECGVKKAYRSISPGNQVIWTRIQVGRTLLNCKIASRMIIDNSTMMPSKITILRDDDALSQQIYNQGLNLLTTFNIPRFSESVELDPVFNALILDDDSNLPYQCTEKKKFLF
ncbi:IPT/TIG domain-containing protein [Cavenderia fasciculata]|uniref:IPT/TIG domain-containing protein n=1 Tax=Cavenderia fasciculata TaxID=261658 RepID=F4Q4N2_CACFS|nr:IPT/TIG domain-containing protein [Cavenderia fasciculata]EGG17041.1 IPT/TIG domain-containing protein [Cavenderia fasciculata]|eukprot:XP_004355525.1 IPT/TIG domain-containing protein [Cavenderia fasciculata]